MPSVISLAAARQNRVAAAETALAPRQNDMALGARLLAVGEIDAGALDAALAEQGRTDLRLSELLIARGDASADAVADALAELHATGRADFAAYPPDPRLIDALAPARCLRDGILPWRRVGGATLIATSRPDRFAQLADELPADLSPAIMVICREDELQEAVAASRAPLLARAAETRVNDWESCRFWYASGPRIILVATALTIAAAALAAPRLVLAGLVLWTVAWMVAGSALKAAAAIAEARAARRERRQPPEDAPTIARLPTVSILVPLFRETELASRLIARLARLDYPRALLDICLVTEDGDTATRAMLARTDLPPWMRSVTVPDGRLRTKPRALNYALEFCRGSIIGVYDAEDAPAPDQIRKMVDHFHRRGAEVACLQGVLDFYNSRANWLSRCFAAEYAAWFRVVLPGLARLGIPVPLGGTTLFFRRTALEALGGWDAHNVTEDADLGLRLARHGYRTEFLDSVTEEEANCRAWPWVRQRSRWLKGYAMTWTTHMRHPLRLWRQLGPLGFLGTQVLFLGTLTQFVFAPLIWSFWVLPLGLPHPLSGAAPASGMTALFALFLGAEIVNLAIGAMGARRADKSWLIPWLPTLHLYFPLASLASYKAIWEMARKPFFWDKTRHGLHGPEGGATAAARRAATAAGPISL